MATSNEKMKGAPPFAETLKRGGSGAIVRHSRLSLPSETALPLQPPNIQDFDQHLITHDRIVRNVPVGAKVEHELFPVHQVVDGKSVGARNLPFKSFDLEDRTQFFGV